MSGIEVKEREKLWWGRDDGKKRRKRTLELEYS